MSSLNDFIGGNEIDKNDNHSNNNKDHIYTGKLFQQNEFAAINQGPVSEMCRCPRWMCLAIFRHSPISEGAYFR